MSRIKNHCLRALVITLLCWLALAEYGAGQARGKTVQAPSGRAVQLPVEAPVPGKSTRQQVEEQYKSVAVDSGVPNLFWGRFRKSRWAIYEAGGRVWDTYNLLVSFDSSGIVKTCETVTDKKLFARFVSLYQQQAFPPLDLSQPIQVSGRAAYQAPIPVDLQLSATGMLVTTLKPSRQSSDKPKPREAFTVPVAQVSAINSGTWNARQEASEIPLELRFSRKTTLGKYIYFSVEPSAALTLVRWLEQVKPGKK